MRKLLTFTLISAFLLTGCELKGAAAKEDQSKKMAHSQNFTNSKESDLPLISLAAGDQNQNIAWRKAPVFKPNATLSISPVNYQSTKATILLTDRKVSVSKVNYYIWRTADGPDNMKKFSSDNMTNNFSISLDINDYSAQRGEYQVEAYSALENGEESLIAKSAVTFQQYVPILMYHAVDVFKGDGLKGLFVSPTDFEAQMQFLKDHGFTLLTFEHYGDINKVNKPIFITFDDGMKNNMNALRIFEKLQDDKFKPKATLYMIANSIDGGPFWLSSDDLKEMVNSGIFSVQSHTTSHADLPKITNYEEELKNPKQKIEQVTGKPVISIAYPFGHYNEKVVEETKKYYQFATTTEPGQFIEKGQKDELLMMHRVRISDTTTLAQFAALVQ